MSQDSTEPGGPDRDGAGRADEAAGGASPSGADADGADARPSGADADGADARPSGADARPSGADAAAHGATAARMPRHAEGTPTASSPARSKQRRERPLWLSLLTALLVGVVVVSIVQALAVRVHAVSSGSMEQTLGVTDRILSSRLPYLTSGPQRGDIIIFSHGDTWDTTVRSPDPNPLKQALRLFGDVTGIGISDYNYTVKRVIGVAGDSVACCDVHGAVTVNGVALVEPYIYQDLPFREGTLDCTTSPVSARCFGPVVVPEGRLLVMGDHRSDSADSVLGCRGDSHGADCAKFVTVAQVSGKVIARAWPPGPIG